MGGRDLVGGMAVCAPDLVVIDQAGGEHIEDHLCPQGVILHLDVLDGCPHRVHADEAAYAEGGGNEPADRLPCARNALLGPADATEEEEGNGGEDHQ